MKGPSKLLYNSISIFNFEKSTGIVYSNNFYHALWSQSQEKISVTENFSTGSLVVSATLPYI
jgi:hypothetical protein